MTLTELKGHAYDCIVTIEQWQRELQETNRRIAEEVQKNTNQPTQPTEEAK